MNMCKSILFASIFAAACAGTQAQAAFECSQPFQRSGAIALPVGYSGNTASIYVPAGFRLKLSYVSVSLTLMPGGRAAFEVGSYANGQYAAYALPVQSGYNVYDRQASQAIEISGDAGSPLLVRAYRGTGTTTSTNARYAVSGCLIPTS